MIDENNVEMEENTPNDTLPCNSQQIIASDGNSEEVVELRRKLNLANKQIVQLKRKNEQLSHSYEALFNADQAKCLETGSRKGKIYNCRMYLLIIRDANIKKNIDVSYHRFF